MRLRPLGRCQSAGQAPPLAGDAPGARIWRINPAGGIWASRLLRGNEDAAIKPRAASLSLLALG